MPGNIMPTNNRNFKICEVSIGKYTMIYDILSDKYDTIRNRIYTHPIT